MEQFIGSLWDRWITQAARRRFPEAAVTLAAVAPTVGVLFRALGGEAGLHLVAVEEQPHAARRGWLQRVAGSGGKTPGAWRDREGLRLPVRIDLFPERELNRELYLWLAALLAVTPERSGADWPEWANEAVAAVLERFPGVAPRYRRLVTAHLDQRPDPGSLPVAERRLELAIREALLVPERARRFPPGTVAPWPVAVWPYPDPPLLCAAGGAAVGGEEREPGAGASLAGDGVRHRGRRIAPPSRRGGLLLHRFDAFLSWAEFVPVDRPVEEDESPEAARELAADLDELAVTRSGAAPAKRIRFDLDLPAEAVDHLPLGGEVTLPEWDWRRRVLQPGHCRLLPLIAREALPLELPARLESAARDLRGWFRALQPGRVWLRRRPDGVELDLDAYLEERAGRRGGQGRAEPRIYRDFRPGRRDLACLLLADLSLSTDAWVDDEHRVIDVIRDSLYLFAEALSASGDRFALHGFSSRRREHVRFHHLKGFDEPYGPLVRGRIQAIQPGYYTRMGAAIRQSAALLEREAATRRLLLVLTDGKPNDLDQYEGRYGIEDTRHALLEAQGRGVRTFCVTIDERAGEYSSHLFGPGGFAHVRHPAELPRQLPRLFARVARE